MAAQYPWDQQPVERKFPVKTTVLIAVLALALVIGVFLIVRPSPVREIVIEKELVAAAVMASFVDNNFNYGPQANNEYLEDNGIYIYIEVINFNQTTDFKVDLTEDLEIKDSDGNTVFERKAFGVNRNQYSTRIDSVRFKNVVPTLNWKTGKYTARIVINDNIAKKTTTNVLQFTIREKSAEVLEKTIDLSSIVSTDITATKLTKQQTVTDPSGKIIPELSFTVEIQGDLSTVDLTNILASVQIPSRFDAGTYTVEVKYTNMQNGKSVSVKDTITVVKQLSIDQFVFAKSIDENYVYQIQPNNVYKLGDTVYIYMRLVDFAQPLVNGKYDTKLTEDVSILDESGKILSSKNNFVTINNTDTIKRDSYSIKNAFTTIALKPGSYVYRVIIKDLNSGQTTTREERFSVE